MPYTWMAFTTMTAPALEGKTPLQIKEVFEELAAERREHGGETELLDVFFDIGKEVGYALYKDLGDSREIKKTSSKIGAIGVTKMLAAEQAEEILGPAQA
jgi:hypothetical protein